MTDPRQASATLSDTMLFCSHCGQPVQPADAFCGHCGARQPSAGAAGFPPPPPPPPGTGIDTAPFTPRQASICSYIPWIGWIFAIITLAMDRFRHEHEARFHAFQGLYLFVAYLIADRVLAPFFRALHFPLNPGRLIEVAIVVGGVLMMIHTAQGRLFRIPILAELADKSVAEQNR